MSHSLNTRNNTKKSSVPQPYNWGDNDDTPEDKEEVSNQFRREWLSRIAGVQQSPKYDQEQAELQQQQQHKNRRTHRHMSNKEDESEESTNTDISVRIDKHQAKEAAAARRKAKAREQELRISSMTHHQTPR